MQFVYIFLRTDRFDRWLAALADQTAKARILARIRSAMLGNLGDCKAVGEGVSEMRVHVGPGYRIFFGRTGDAVYILLAGGDKSTQKKDIALAKALFRDFKEIKQ